MTGHQINSLVGDLVAMAQAMERLPIVEAALEAANETIAKGLRVIETMDADLQQSRAYAASLEAKVHAAEVARDDAELRFLELDERMGQVLHILSTSVGALGKASDILNPPKPLEPMPIGDVQPQVTEVHATPVHNDEGYRVGYVDTTTDAQASEVKPIGVDPTPDASSMDKPSGDVHSIVESAANVGQGQSEPDPTANDHGGGNVASSTVQSDGVENTVNASAPSLSTDGVSVPTPPTPAPSAPTGSRTESVASSSKPYAGKRYSDLMPFDPDKFPSGYIPYSAWLDGGGTHDGYYS